MTELLSFWYGWGVFVGVLLTAAAATYIFFDSQQVMWPGRVTWPRILGVVGLVLMLPSLYYRLTRIGEGADLAALFEVDNNFLLFLYLALVGVLLAPGALVYYIRSVRSEREVSYSHESTREVSYSLASPLEEIPPPAPLLPARNYRPTMNVSPADIGARSPRPKTEVLGFHRGLIAFFIDMETGRQFTVADGSTIGSSTENDIIIDEKTVSGRHAKVKFQDAEFAIFDLASTNGTVVNGESIIYRVLTDGDKVQMGRKLFTYKRVGDFSQPNRRDTEALDRAGERIQSLRLEAAVPEEVMVGQPFQLAAAVKQLVSQQLNVRGLDKLESEEFKLRIPAGASSLELQVHVQAPDCHVVGSPSQRFELYIGRNSPTLYFTLIPLREGEIFIIVKVTRSFLVLGSARLGLITRERLAGEVKISITSLPIKPQSEDPFSALLPDLSRFIDANFSLHEVRALCFEMGVDYDDLAGGQKSGKIIELILHCRRRDRHEELIERVVQARPNWYEQIS